ncbi:hypothetical protein SAMN04488100_1172 [Alkalibacterium putridalgicola]|uniref:ABC-2 type transport system permease protein n=2 Tax=Alkalibacterium putridalgicola TaxID=426703 RepID=A0A1H7UCL4_9LACT|nr:hypothetical protein [Alkalibacterium putridalgicola]SEL94792.1 hypothetical protein SAMN04488100_1172 [Alkalibacterium putridalgicola]
MIRQVMSETVTYMWRNKKNRLVMILCLGAVLLHSLFILPNTPGNEEVNLTQLERQMEANRQTFEDQLAKGLTVPTFFTGTSAYETARNEYVNQRELLTALNNGDVRRYLEIPYRPTAQGSEEGGGNAFSVPFRVLGNAKEMFFSSQKTDYYLNEAEPLTFHMVHERTSLQQLHLFLIGQGPYILLLLLLFMISDVITKDRSLRTQKAGVPLNWFGYLFIQSVTALGFVTLFFVALSGFFILLNGLLHGFGSIAMPVGALGEAENAYAMLPYITMEVGTFLLRSLPYVLLLMYGFTRLNTLFSLIFRHDIVTFIASVFVLLFPQLYYSPGTEELLGINLSFYPQTYYHFGDVVTSRLNVPYDRGLLVLAVTVLVIELLNVGATKVIKRQSFVR